MTARPLPPNAPTTIRRVLPALLLAGLAALATATPALAHTSLQKSTPAKGAALATAPTQVSLTFGEAVTLPADPIKVVGADGTAWTVGKATVTDATVSAPVTAAGPAGAYTLTWAVVADDGDTIHGTIPFTLTTPATPPTTPPATAATTTAAPTAVAPAASQTPTSTGGGVPAWVWIVLAVIVVLAGAGVVRARSRRASGS